MKDIDIILANLKKKEQRITKIRRAILELLVKIPKPLSSLDIQLLLTRRNIKVNKTTVYRELVFLKKQNIISEVHFGDNIKRYEIMTENHHHHIVCIKCESVEDVMLNKDLDETEKVISRNKNFKILNHSLEFFGLCAECK